MAGLGRGAAAAFDATGGETGATPAGVGGGGGTDAGRGIAGIVPGIAVIWRLDVDVCGVIGGGGTEAGLGTVGIMGLPAGEGIGGGGTDPRRGKFLSDSGDLKVGTAGGGGTEPRRGIVGGSGRLSGGATIFSVMDGNGRRTGAAAAGRSTGFTTVIDACFRSSNTSMASSETSIVGSSRMNAPRATLTCGVPIFACTAAATASLLKIVVTASNAESSSSSSSPPCMRTRMYRAR